MSITPEDIAAAAKKVKADKPRENYMIVSFDGGDVRLVLPHKDGLAIMNALANAEEFNDTWRSDKGIHPLRKDAVLAQPLSAAEYDLQKMAQLLQVSVDDLRQAMKNNNQ